MSLGQAAILGLVEGVTEFLPISSTGHLILAQRAMGIGGSNGNSEAADAYAIVIQAGAILAVLGIYAGIIRRIAAGLAGRDMEGRRLAGNLVVGVRTRGHCRPAVRRFDQGAPIQPVDGRGGMVCGRRRDSRNVAVEGRVRP